VIPRFCRAGASKEQIVDAVVVAIMVNAGATMVYSAWTIATARRRFAAVKKHTALRRFRPADDLDSTRIQP